MTITYRGVSKMDIAESLEAIAMTLISLDVGPRTTETAEFWLAEGGVAAKIRQATSKAEIAAALTMKTPQSNFTTAGWLSELYDALLPNVFSKAPRYEQLLLQNKINAVNAWNGFHSSGGRFHVSYAEDRELKNYCAQKLGLAYDERVSFGPALKSPYRAYEVYASTSTADAVQAMYAYAKANDLEDEFAGQDYTNKGPIYATENFVRLALSDIAIIQAFGDNGKLMTKVVTDTPRPPAL